MDALDRFALAVAGIVTGPCLLLSFEGFLVGFVAALVTVLSARMALVAARDYFGGRS